MNRLYYGDNLEVLRHHVKDESVDLIYLDPPFNSNQAYNVLFAEQNGSQSASQIRAFEDTWRWDQAAARAYEDVVVAGGKVSEAMQAFRLSLGDNNLLAYLAMMAPRLIELRRALTNTGTIYLHCDPTASHYLKVLLDGVFGPTQFRNEIIWRRTMAKGLMSRQLPNNHDVILCYQKGERAAWNDDAIFRPYDPDDLDEKTAKQYSHRDPDGRRYQLTSLTNPNPNRPNLTYEFLGVTRVWRWTKERMEKAYADGIVVQTKPGAVPREKRYLEAQRGKPFGDVWTDIPRLNAMAKERLGYPTQKPEALLERIVRISSTASSVILDPFCGCGTTVAVAQKLGREWIGIDITHLAITLTRHRLRDTYGDEIQQAYEVIGEPVSTQDAKALAKADPYQFQWWALGLVGARPRGIDGRIYFVDGSETKQIILSVKAGKVTVSQLRDLRGVVDREKAAIGVLISMEAPTSAMWKEAATAGFYDSPWGKHPRLQLLTVAELLDGKKIDGPPSRQTARTFKQAPRARQKAAENLELFGQPDEESDPPKRKSRRRKSSN